MDYYLQEFEKLQEDFHDTLHDYPLFQEMLDKIFDEDIEEIKDLLDKNDEYYLKEAIRKLERLIDYIKDTSENIKKEYDKFDTLAKKWKTKEFLNVTDKELDIINSKVIKANELIQSHDLDDIRNANKIMEELLK